MKRIKVRGHYRRVVVDYKVVVDDTNPANEIAMPIYRLIWIAPYEKVIKRGS